MRDAKGGVGVPVERQSGGQEEGEGGSERGFGRSGGEEVEGVGRKVWEGGEEREEAGEESGGVGAKHRGESGWQRNIHVVGRGGWEGGGGRFVGLGMVLGREEEGEEGVVGRCVGGSGRMGRVFVSSHKWSLHPWIEGVDVAVARVGGVGEGGAGFER